MALSAKDLDPVRIYSNAPKLWDFIMLTLLLFYVIKKSFITVRAMRQHGVGRQVVGTLLGGSGDTEHKQTDNTISFILALMMSISLMRYTKFSLELTVTSGILPFFACFMLGMGIYSFLLAVLGPERKLTAGAIGGFVGLLAFLGLQIAAGGNQDWVYVLVWFLLLLIFLSFIRGYEEKVLGPSQTIPAAVGSVNDTIRGASNLENRVAEVGKRTDEIDKSGNTFLDILNDLKASIAQLHKSFQAAAAAVAIVAGATQVAAASPETNRPAIVQQLVKEGVSRAEAEAAADQITFVEEAPAVPSPPPGLKPGPAPEGVVSEAQVTFEAVPPAGIAGSMAGILKEVNDEVDRRKDFLLMAKSVKKTSEAVIRNYIEYGYWNSRTLMETLTKRVTRKNAASFVDFVGKKANEAFKIVHGQVVPKGAAPARVVPKVAPPAGKARPPEKNEELVKQGVKINVQKLELAQSQLLQQIQSFIKISELLKEIPNYVPQLKKSGDKAQAELSKIFEESKKLAKKAESPDYNSMLEYAKSLESVCSTLSATLTGANNTFNDGLKPLSSFLITDERALQNLTGELNSILPEFKSAIEDMKARSDELKDKGATQDVMAPYSAAFDKVDNLITRVITSFEQHAKDIPETLKTGLEGFIPILQSYQNSLKYIVPQVQALKSRWAMINDEMAKIDSEKKKKVEAETKERGHALIDKYKVKTDARTLNSIITGLLIAPISGKIQGSRDSAFIPISKGDVIEMQTQARNAIDLFGEFDAVRQKVVDMATGNKELNDFLGLLERLRSFPLRNDLVDFVNNRSFNGMADNPKGDSRLGRAIVTVIFKVSGRTDIDALGNILNELAPAVDKLPKGAVQ